MLVTVDNLCQAQEETAFHKIRFLRQSEVLDLCHLHTRKLIVLVPSGCGW